MHGAMLAVAGVGAVATAALVWMFRAQLRGA
jgi:hypothetical protein